MRLTISTPAMRVLQEPPMIAIAHQDGAMRLRAAPRRLNGVEATYLNVEPRGVRGGGLVVIPEDVSLPWGETIYWNLIPAGSGWYRMDPLEGAAPPPRQLAVVRLWRDRDGLPRADPPPVEADLDALPFAGLVLAAHAECQRAVGSVGRPSQDLAQAKRIMSAFDALARSVGYDAGRADAINRMQRLLDDLRRD